MSTLLCAFTAPIEHGCLILQDAQSTSEHSQWDPTESLYDIKEDSVIFSVIPSVDGPVNVRVWRTAADPNGPEQHYFAAVVHTTHGRLILHDPNDYVSLNFQAFRGENRFSIRTDSVEFPEVIDIVFEDQR